VSLPPGTRLGPYEITTPVGAGGMGEVYRAHDTRLGRDVAIKVLPPGFTEDPARLRRFQQEARTLAALSHPNVLAVFDVGTHGGSPYLVMELLEGKTLRDLLASGPVPARRAVELALQIARGLSAAHAKGLVHRDLKPANLFITEEGHLKILDFGLAKQTALPQDPQSQVPTREDAGGTSEGLILGTSGYMSPEQVMGRPADARSDLFAVGVVLYEALSGRRAFERSSAIETLSATLKEEPPGLESPFGPIPLSLRRLVAHCLEKDPGRRSQSAQDLEYGLDAILGELTLAPGLALRIPWLTGPRLGPRVLGLVVLVLGVFGAALVLWRPAPGGIAAGSVPSVVTLPAKVFGGQESAFLTDAIPDTLSTLLAGVEGLDTRVPPSSAQVEKVQGDVTRIAEAYRAEFLVFTSVTAEGDRLHLNVKLAEGATQKVRWAGQFEGTREAYASLLHDAAQGLARALKPSGAGAVGQMAFSSEVELALREGKYFQQRYARSRDDRDFDLALAAFRKAQSMAPSSALLAAAIAGVFQEEYFGTRSPKSLSEAEQWAARSLALDPRCGRAWATRCMIETSRPRSDPATVVDFALKAARYAPDDARIHIVLGAIAPTAGFQAATGFRAMELNPLDPTGYSWAAMCLATSGHPEEGLPLLERAIRVEPRPGFHTWLKFFCLFHAGRFGEARQAYTEVQWAEVSQLMRFLMAEDLEGGRRLARKLVAEWRKAEMGSMGWVNLASFHAPLLIRLGMKEEALWVLDKSAATAFPPAYDFLLVDPDMQKVRSDPRFARALAVSRKYAVLFLERANEAKARGDFPVQLDRALTELRALVDRNP